MATDTSTELNKLFATPNESLDQAVQNELQSVLRLHDLSPQELFYKWDSYSFKLGGNERLKLDIQRVRDLKRDIQETLEREAKGKVHARNDRRAVGATPRVAAKAAPGDMFSMMDGVVQTPARPLTNTASNASAKRKHDFATPASKISKPHATSSPSDAKVGNAFTTSNVAFSERQNAEQIIETLNGQIDIPEPPAAPFATSRIALKANSDLKKFAYKTMAMKLSEASEILDDRIDEILALVQEYHQLEDGAFGNPSVQSTSEIVAVGRIACDTSEGTLKPGSIVLESSRRTGAGLRIPLELDRVPGYELFPGKIVAARGTNVSGEGFSVSEFLSIPPLQSPASHEKNLEEIGTRLRAGAEASDLPQPLNIITSAGPYTADSDLSYEPLQALVDRAISTSADALILLGPFLDIEHPLVRLGQFPPLPQSLHIDPDTATLTDVFRGLVAPLFQQLAKALPGILIIMVPSVRDAVNKHTAWPQEKMAVKQLGLPKQCAMATNPVMLSLNELVVGISSADILYDLRWEQYVGGKPSKTDPLARLSKHMIEQRHFYPLYPPKNRESLPKPAAAEGLDGEEGPVATGAMLDVSYTALGDWHTCKPDLLVTPSVLNPFAKVVDGVTVVNPGMLWARQKGAGSYAQMYIKEREVAEEEKGSTQPLAHKVWERARIDVVRI